MLQLFTTRNTGFVRFDLAPTGALCYIFGSGAAPAPGVLISLPQERCATSLLAHLRPRHQF